MGWHSLPHCYHLSRTMTVTIYPRALIDNHRLQIWSRAQAGSTVTLPAVHSREELDTYPKRFSMERTAEESYDLNISRYISMGGDKVEIDLLVTHEELVRIDKQIRAATVKHTLFLRKLGLPGVPVSDE